MDNLQISWAFMFGAGEVNDLSTWNAQWSMTLSATTSLRTRHSLTDRVNLAKELATSVNYVHTLDFVHKNTRPETFLGFSGIGDSAVGVFFSIDFVHVRCVEGHTYMRGDEALKTDLYRRPDRQGSFPEEKYNMQHHIHSLGMCLLEIGLWATLVEYGHDGKVTASGSALELSLDEFRRMRPVQAKGHLVALAERRPRQLMGAIFTEVVATCLTCLDDSNMDYDDFNKDDDEDGVSIAVEYIEKID